MYVYTVNCPLIVKDGLLIAQCIIVLLIYDVLVPYPIILPVSVVPEMRTRCILLFLYDITADIVS